MRWFLLAVSFQAQAACLDVYNPFTRQWDYVCTPDPTEQRIPVCTQEYDAMNQVWVTVCR